MAKPKRILTDKQERFCDLVASGKSLQDSILQAGYKSSAPLQMGAGEVRKEWIKARIKWLSEHKYDKPAPACTEPKVKAIMSDDELEVVMSKHAESNAQAANNLAALRLKRQGQGVGIDVVPVLLSAFLSEKELDRYRDGAGEDVVVATEEGRGKPSVVDGGESGE